MWRVYNLFIMFLLISKEAVLIMKEKHRRRNMDNQNNKNKNNCEDTKQL